ncbi:hypothetical protein [Erythrobacter tepidarius]|uniref:hypothetical protein n=1 Tax=Erythrobacter tepidarius TaxID=60454 RepID=UPI000A39FBDE|nr:hypothetical protein [Erythrobacter tepidarius]
MHKSLTIFALAGAGLIFAALPAALCAQTEAPAEGVPSAEPMTAEQEAVIATWPADRQQAFKAWPSQTQSYFWSLSEARRELFWALPDSDKVALSQMAEAQRESVWAEIEARTRPPRSG